jgi:glc operon protein GlcG
MRSDGLPWRMQRRNWSSAMHFKPSLDLSAAAVLLSTALEVAREHGVAVSVAVVDDAGELLAFSRMDGARSFTIDLASEKARGAASLGLPTSVLESLGRRTRNGNLWTRGGKPVLYEGQCAGAIGVSGAEPHVDDEIGERAIASLEARPPGSP